MSEQKPRILIVTGVLWIGGGAEKVAANLGNYLTDQGYETHLLTFYEAPEKYPYHGIYHTLNEQPKTKLQKLWRVPQRIYAIAQYARQHKITFAYAFLEEANFYTLLAKWLFVRRLRVVVSVRNNINQRSWLFRTLSRMLYPGASRVVSVTKAVEEILKTDLKLKNTTTIYNSIDTDLVASSITQPIDSRYQRPNTSGPHLVSAGRLIQQKGQWHLIRAFSALRTEFPAATLSIIGEGEYRSQLEQLRKDCQLEQSVRLLGKHKNVYALLAQGDVFVFSSLYEGMPNTMLEALAVGLPIVSTDCVSGPREIIAPSVGVSETITYPYTSEYGVLVPAPEHQPPIWQTPAQVPLTSEEQQLVAALSDVLERQWFRGTTYQKYHTRVSEGFAVDRVMRQWEQLIYLTL